MNNQVRLSFSFVGLAITAALLSPSVCQALKTDNSEAAVFILQQLSDELNNSVLSDKNRVDRLLARGNLYYNSSQFDLAEADFRAASKLNTDSRCTSLWHLTRTLLALRRRAEGEQCLGELSMLEGESKRVMGTRAAGELARGQFQRAANIASQIIELDSDYRYAYYIRGTAYYMLKRPTDAVSDFETVMFCESDEFELMKRPSSFLLYKAQALEDCGRHVDSTLVLRDAVKASPNSVEVLCTYSRRQMMDGYFDEASVTAERAMKLDSDNPVVIRATAVSCVASGQFSRAVELIDKWLELEPESIGAHRLLCRAFLEAGDGAAAIEHAERLLALNESVEWPKYELIMVYTRNSDPAYDPARALKIVEELPETSDPPSIGWFVRGLAFAANADWEKADEYLKKTQDCLDREDRSDPSTISIDAVGKLRRLVGRRKVFGDTEQ